MLYFILGHYKWNEKDNKIYQKYIDITNKELDKLSNIKKKYPEFVLSKNYVSLVDMVGSSNLYSKDLNPDRGVNIDTKNTINRHKEIIDEIFDKKKTTDLTLKKVVDDLEKLLSLTSKNSLITYLLYQPNRRETISGAYDAPPLLNQLRSLEKQGRLTFVDSITEFGKYKLNASEIFPVNDGSHPNANGHKILADRLFDSLIVQVQ